MRSLFFYWHFDPFVFSFLMLLCGLYLHALNFKLKSKSFYFLTGILLIVICVASPLHFLAEHYLFSAHMVSHVILLLLAGPLLVAGIPEESRWKKWLLSFSPGKLKNLLFCWFTGVGIMWFWHIPAIFNEVSSGNGMSMMYIEWLSFLSGGMLFSLPIIHPCKEKRILPLSAVLYLSTACMFCTILGLMITFAPLGIYEPYLNISDSYGFLNVIRGKWNISAASDQQAAGLIMWVPCCFIYLSVSMAILIHWFDKKVLNSVEEAELIHPGFTDPKPKG